VLCKRHDALFSECGCGISEWHHVYDAGEAAVIARHQETGCSAEAAWAWWQDDKHSVAGTETPTIAYDDAGDADDASQDTLSTISEGSEGDD
jgi:hypothetical protein